MVEIVNVVVQTDLHACVDLVHLVKHTMNIRYDPALFSAAIWQHRKIGGCCLVFKNGKLNCNGNRNIREGRKRIRQYARLIQKQGFPVNIHKIDVITMSAVHQISSKLDFSKLCKLLPSAIYEPEIHNAAMLKRGKVHFNCFQTGNVVSTGLRDTSVIYPTLLELELCTTT